MLAQSSNPALQTHSLKSRSVPTKTISLHLLSPSWILSISSGQLWNVTKCIYLSAALKGYFEVLESFLISRFSTIVYYTCAFG